MSEQTKTTAQAGEIVRFTAGMTVDHGVVAWVNAEMEMVAVHMTAHNFYCADFANCQLANFTQIAIWKEWSTDDPANRDYSLVVLDNEKTLLRIDGASDELLQSIILRIPSAYEHKEQSIVMGSEQATLTTWTHPLHLNSPKNV